jgi:AraC family transcriptional regulator
MRHPKSKQPIENATMTDTSNASFARMEMLRNGAGQASTSVRHFEQLPPQPDFKSPLQSGRGFLNPIVQISPVDSVKRLGTGWQGWFAESIHAPAGKKIAFRFQGPAHLLVIYNEGTRRDGEASVEGLPPSRIRNVANKLTFVPAGCAYREWIETGASTRATFLYLEPSTLQNETETPYAPRIHFEDPVVWETAAKLTRAIENGQTKRARYLEALSGLLGLELTRPEVDTVRDSLVNRGGLASWQKRAVVGFIEENLGEQICLVTLARLVRLSLHHFCRAFKQSFGIPPHLYHVQRRIERAKVLLADRTESVTDIALTVGYSQISSFSVAFRKMTGWTPSEYRREFESNSTRIRLEPFVLLAPRLNSKS